MIYEELSCLTFPRAGLATQAILLQREMRKEKVESKLGKRLNTAYKPTCL